VLIDRARNTIHLPQDGLVLSRTLAGILHVTTGDVVRAEFYEIGNQPRMLTVTGLVDDAIGLFAYMDINALNRTLNLGDRLSAVAMQVDGQKAPARYRALRRFPKATAVAIKKVALDSVEEQMAKALLVSAIILSVFAAVVATGIVYNAARINLSERAHELASLRVLGLTRAEVSTIFLAETGLTAALGIPVGFLMGYGLAWLQMDMIDPRQMRLELFIASRTYALAGLVVVVSAIVTALRVRTNLDHLDLVAVLKVRE